MTPYRQLTRRTAHKQQGFTLIELMMIKRQTVIFGCTTIACKMMVEIKPLPLYVR